MVWASLLGNQGIACGLGEGCFGGEKWGRERRNVKLTLKGEKLNYLNASSFKGRENLLFINNERLINV